MKVKTAMELLPSHHDNEVLIVKVSYGEDAKGVYDEYAPVRGFVHHPTHGAFTVCTPDHDKTFKIYRGDNVRATR